MFYLFLLFIYYRLLPCLKPAWKPDLVILLSFVLVKKFNINHSNNDQKKKLERKQKFLFGRIRSVHES